MINNFDLCIGTKFVFGRNAQCKVGKELKDRGISKVLLNYDGGEYLSHVLFDIKNSLHKYNIDFVDLGGVEPNPKLSLVRKGIEVVKNNCIDGIVAIGGGSVIDSSKAIGIGAAGNCDVWDYFTGFAKVKSSLPVFSVLTLPASGSESSKVVVINNDSEHLKLLISNTIVRPVVAFMNPELTLSVPAYPTACGIVDMFSHICERYFSDDNDFGVVDSMCEGVLRTLISIGPRCLENLENYDLRAQIMWISTIAQNNTFSIGRNEDWSTHTLANEISALYNTPHGATLSIIMCSWMKVASSKNAKRFARYAKEVFGISTEANVSTVDSESYLVNKGILETEKFFKSLGMPTSFEDAGLPKDGIDKMLSQIEFFGEDNSIGSVARLNPDDCKKIYQLSMHREIC